jgi:hypothetical protein
VGRIRRGYLALAHNHSLKATRTLILQNQAQEIAANLRPNPTLVVDGRFVYLLARKIFLGTTRPVLSWPNFRRSGA